MRKVCPEKLRVFQKSSRIFLLANIRQKPDAFLSAWLNETNMSFIESNSLSEIQ